MKLIVFTDGASRGNPGLASYGFVVFNQDREVLYEEGKYIGVTTNNVAEYSSVLESLRYIEKTYEDKLPIEVDYYADSRLVVEQLSGRFKIKSPHLMAIIVEIRKLEKGIGKIIYHHVPREQNKVADRLANVALDSL